MPPDEPALGMGRERRQHVAQVATLVGRGTQRLGGGAFPVAVYVVRRATCGIAPQWPHKRQAVGIPCAVLLAVTLLAMSRAHALKMCCAYPGTADWDVVGWGGAAVCRRVGHDPHGADQALPSVSARLHVQELCTDIQTHHRLGTRRTNKRVCGDLIIRPLDQAHRRNKHYGNNDQYHNFSCPSAQPRRPAVRHLAWWHWFSVVVRH